MARTIIGVNDARAVKRYSGNLALDTSAKSYFSNRFMARGARYSRVYFSKYTGLYIHAARLVHGRW